MGRMKKEGYHCLVNDTLTYLKETLARQRGWDKVADETTNVSKQEVASPDTDKYTDNVPPLPALAPLTDPPKVVQAVAPPIASPVTSASKEKVPSSPPQPHRREPNRETDPPKVVQAVAPPIAPPATSASKEKVPSSPPQPHHRDQKPTELEPLFIALEPPKPPVSYSPAETLTILQKIMPELPIYKAIPSDRQAKKIKDAWQEQEHVPAIPILFQGKSYRQFLAKIARAIEVVHPFSSHPIEVTSTKKWDLFLASHQLKLIIAPEVIIFDTPPLRSLYQAIPQQQTSFLGKIPLLLLPDVSRYFNNPNLKRSLWNTICNAINLLASS